MVFMVNQIRVTQKWSKFSPNWNTNNTFKEIIIKSNVDVINQEFKQFYKLHTIKYNILYWSEIVYRYLAFVTLLVTHTKLQKT